MATEQQKMIAGELYRPGDPELVAARKRAQSLMRDYNGTIYGDSARRQEILEALLGSMGADCVLRAPLYVDYGASIHLGREVFMNYGCVLLDGAPIRIGDRVQIGPAVQILTADHPRDAETRKAGLEFGKPITIGADVWIGGGAIILPGVTVGEGAIVGAGAVVTRDVPPGATVAGSPARVLENRGHTP
ncbi:sugar O-acetyltransferase [Poseidonocella sedimentorum]|uniref:Nodulation protein L n=1 Tax=Poseidonocella sedimentorum TaxID=871652 RepID=A0A1I6E8R2_9RHOB|nr:sugar O-acetyltransferase [Poseidonocella sedimentorum]SFR13908.1 maltose O-acetyltransferase [Poseidonocella sedimentorum]